MKNLKKLICVILVVLMVPVWALGCDNGSKSPKNGIAIIENGATVYKLIRSDSSSSSVMKLCSAINTAVKEKCGVDIEMDSDWLDKGAEPDANIKEILIGNTNRPESAQVMEELSDYNFGIDMVGNKIVITSKDDTSLSMAVSYFIDNYILSANASEGNLYIKTDIKYISSSEFITVAQKGGSDNYAITYPNSEKVYTKLNYNKSDGDNLESFARDLGAVIQEKTGISNMVYNNDLVLTESMKANEPNWKEILVGETIDREETKKALTKLDFDEYAIKVDGNKIVVTGIGHLTTREAVSRFKELLEKYKLTNSDGSVTYRLPSDFYCKEKYSEFSKFELNIPRYEGGRLTSATNGSEDSYVAVYDETNKTEYDAYLAKLEANGYTKYTDNTIVNNYFATYKNGSTIINADYFENYSEVRLIVEKTRTTVLPGLASDNVYTDKGIEPTLTQMYLQHIVENNGMCYILQLCDGRFIVIDGGVNEKQKDKDDADNLYDLLVKMAPKGETPTIAAWFITHPHNDHYNCMVSFTSKYGKKVKIEQFIYNFPQNGLFQQTLDPAIEKAMKSISGAKLIRAHVGQKYYISNAEVEMLCSMDLVYPNYSSFTNDSSLVFFITIAGQKILITGDASPNTCPIMCDLYGEYLKTDILQIAHHGSYGGTMDFYKLAHPSKLALLPMGIGQEGRLNNEPENVYIATLVTIIPHFRGTRTFKLPY